MNELQRVEFEILKQVISICEKHNILYFLVCGSALGAVKYGGFIPWDDDIDIAFIRNDYIRFLELAKEELPEYLFIQNSETDEAFPLTGSKIRDTRTTFIESFHKKIDMCHGVYIDVFPLDTYPTEKYRQVLFEARKKILENKRDARIAYERNYKYYIRYPLRAFMYILFRLGICDNTQGIIRKLTTLYTTFPLEQSEFLCNYSNSISKKEYANKEQYGIGEWFLFEGINVRIPKKYDEYLSQKYGDWRSDLPENRKKSHHNAEVIDLGKSYLEYRGKGYYKNDY